MKLKTVLPRVQAVVRGHPLSAVCCPNPLRSSVCSFSPSRQKALFSAGGDHRRTPITPKHFMLQKSQICNRAPGGLVNAVHRPHEAPASHMQDLSQSREKWSVCWQLFAETGGIDYLLGVVWGCLGTLKGLSTSSLFIPSLSLCLAGQSERLWGGCLPMSRQVLNIWCVPSGIGSLLMAIFNIRPPRSKARHSLWTYPINNVPPQTKINTHTGTNLN